MPVSTHLIELHGSPLKTAAPRPPALRGGMFASSRIGVAHFSQLGEETWGGAILKDNKGRADGLFKIAQYENGDHAVIERGH